MDIRPILASTATKSELLDTDTAKQGWLSVESIFLNPEGLYTQPAGHLLYVLEKNLTLALKDDAPYRQHARRCGNDDYWTARIARLQEIIGWIKANA